MRVVPCVTRRKHHRPSIAPNDNTTHVPNAGSSAAPTKPNHTPSRHSRAKGKLFLQTVTPHAAGSRRTHVSRTQECARTHPVTRRATPSTCTHRTSQPAEVADATTIRTPPASCQLTGPMALLPINQKAKWVGGLTAVCHMRGVQVVVLFVCCLVAAWLICWPLWLCHCCCRSWWCQAFVAFSVQHSLYSLM